MIFIRISVQQDDGPLLNINETVNDQDWTAMRPPSYPIDLYDYPEVERRHERRHRFIDHLAAKFANALTNVLTDPKRPA